MTWDGTERRSVPRRQVDAAPAVDANGKNARRLTTFMTVAVAVLTVAFGTSLVLLVFGGNEPDLIEWDLQRVEEVTPGGNVRVPRVPGYEKPSVEVGEHVPVRGVRSIDPSVTEPIEATSDMWWERVEPAGVRIQVLTDFVATIEDLGDQFLAFENEMPLEVQRRVIADKRETELWRIVGNVKPEGGAVSSFTTEPFIIVNTVDFIEGPEDGDE